MNSRTTSIGILAFSLVTISSVGCQRPMPPEGPTASIVAPDRLDALWEASLDELRRHDFQPDRQDRAQGVITTVPVTSKQWGEFWRRDIDDSYSYGESSLQTVQRQATVRFIHEKDWAIQVQIDVLRLSMPESQITTASSAIQSFSGALPTAEGSMQISGPARKRWVLIRRDGAMEHRLLDRILSRANLLEIVEEP